MGYVNASQNPTTTSRLIAWTVSDGVGVSGSATRSLAVTAANDALWLSRREDRPRSPRTGRAAIVDPGIAISDVDSATLAGATIWISSGYSSGLDVLAFTGQSGISGSWDTAAATLTLTGSASIAGYQAAHAP